MKKLIILIFLLCSLSLSAQEIEHTAIVDWEKGSITITAVYHGGYSPLLRTNGEKALDSYIDTFFKEKILSIQYDSFRTIQDIAIAEPGIMNALSNIGLQGEKTSSRMSNFER